MDQLESVEVCGKLDGPAWGLRRWASSGLCPKRGASGASGAAAWPDIQESNQSSILVFFTVLATSMVPPFPVTCSLQPEDIKKPPVPGALLQAHRPGRKLVQGAGCV